MKKTAIIILVTAAALFAGVNLSAQGKWGPDSAECVKYMSFYKEFFKQKNYDDATPNWREAYRICPATASQNMLIEGCTLVKRLIAKNGRNPEYKAALVDTLMTLYDLRAENYPKYAVTALNNKGVDMYNFKKDDSEYLYKNFSSIVANNQESTNPSIFLFHLQSAIDLYQAGKIEAMEVIDVYQNNVNLLEKATPKDDKEAEKISNVKNDMGSVFASSKVASCDNLIEIFTPKFNENPEDAALAANIVKTMNFTEGCSSNELYLRAVTVMYDKDPSSAAAYALFKLNSSRGNTDDAIKYMEEAIAATDTDAERDAELSYELAAYCFKSGLNAKAYNFAQQAIALGDSMDGKAYFLIGTIWFSTRCGGDEITSKAPFWVASDYFAKAKAADESLAEEANRYISRCASYYPDTADAFMYNLTKGQSYTAACGGLTASTTVKTR